MLQGRAKSKRDIGMETYCANRDLTRIFATKGYHPSDTMPCKHSAGVAQLAECQPSKPNVDYVSNTTDTSNGTLHSVSNSNQDGLAVGLIAESWSRLSPRVQAKILDVVKKAIT